MARFAGELRTSAALTTGWVRCDGRPVKTEFAIGLRRRFRGFFGQVGVGNIRTPVIAGQDILVRDNPGATAVTFPLAWGYRATTLVPFTGRLFAEVDRIDRAQLEMRIIDGTTGAQVFAWRSSTWWREREIWIDNWTVTPGGSYRLQMRALRDPNLIHTTSSVVAVISGDPDEIMPSPGNPTVEERPDEPKPNARGQRKPGPGHI